MHQLTHLQTFLDCYRSGSLTKAAEHLSITQPAASLHIKALEALAGKALFVRQARGVAPTAAADDLARAISPHLDALEAALVALRSYSGELSGTVHVAGPAEYLSAHIAPVLSGLLAKGLRVRLQLGNRDQIWSLLSERAVDLAVITQPREDEIYGCAQIGRERLLLVAAKAFVAQLGERPVLLETLGRFPCVAYDEHLPLVREFFETVFDAPANHQAVLTAPDLRMLLELVLDGIGWSVLPDYLAMAHLETGDLVELPTAVEGPVKPLYLVWNKSALRYPRVLYTRDYLLEQARSRSPV